MNEIFQKAIADSNLLRKTEVPWKLDEPFPQPYPVFDTVTSAWTPETPPPHQHNRSTSQA